jgi:hypothetical protein
MLVDQHQSDRPLTHFGGKLVRRFAHDGSSFSGVEPSGKPSAVQILKEALEHATGSKKQMLRSLSLPALNHRDDTP